MIGFQNLLIEQNIKVVQLASELGIRADRIWYWIKNNKVSEKCLGMVATRFNVSENYLNEKVNNISTYKPRLKGFNEYTIIDDYVEFEIKDKYNNTYKVKVDLDELDKLKEFNMNWQPTWSGTAKLWYIHVAKFIGNIDGKNKYQGIYLHRRIMNAKRGEYVHHKNHDTFDNRKSNLEITTNSRNLKIRLDANSNSKSGHRNVSLRNNKWWIVQFQINGKNTVMGKFIKLDEAVKFAEEQRPLMQDYI